jgi:7-cyano-7-deazaguanine reductase
MDETGLTRHEASNVKRETGRKHSKHTRLGYNEDHAKSGITASLPGIETFSNQYKGYEITIEIPEYTAICPKTGLPDFGTITLHYMPDKECLELKSLKMYLHAYRNLGIFYENAVNRILHDVVKACRPVWARVTGEFTARGGLSSKIVASYP